VYILIVSDDLVVAYNNVVLEAYSRSMARYMHVACQDLFRRLLN